MSKRMNFKRTLVAAACAVSVMTTAIPVSAAEMVDPAVIAQLEDSISVASDCNCKKDWIFMSRQCSRNDDSTHTAYYTFHCECEHGSHTKVETIKENHTYGGYKDGGHVSDKREHIWYKECVCGDKKGEYFFCMGAENGGNHVQP